MGTMEEVKLGGSEIAQHWPMLFGATLLFFTTAGAVFGAPPTLYSYLAVEFEVSTGSMAVLPSLFQLFWGLASFPAALATTKFGVTPVFRVGVVSVAILSTLYPFARNIWHLYALHAAFGCVWSVGGLVSQILFVSSWFRQQRGLAVGVVVTGFSLSGVLWPPVVAFTAEKYGWRVGYGLVPCTLWAVAVPTVFRLRDGHWGVRDAPGKEAAAVELAPLVLERGEREGRSGDHGAPHGGGSGGGGGGGGGGGSSSGSGGLFKRSLGSTGSLQDLTKQAEAAPQPNCTFEEAVRTPQLKHLAVMSFWVLYIITGVMHTLVLYMTSDAGIPNTHASIVLGTVFAFSVVGKLLFGHLFDSAARQLASLMACGALFLGVALMLSWEYDPHAGTLMATPAANLGLLGVFAVVYGTGYGACFTLISAKPAALFGTRCLSKLQNFLNFWQIMGGLAGASFTGVLREHTGSYTLPFAMYILAGALVCVHCAWLETHPFVPGVST